jgi:long-chain fatty acid transport protein
MDATGRRFLRKTAQTQGILRLWLLSTPQPPVTMTQAGRARKDLGDTMSMRGWAGVLRASSALGLLVVATAQANAGGFALREQSTYGQGTSFAGIAAGGALSSMFWNPATMTQFPAMGIEVGASAIFPFANNTAIAGTLVGPPFNFGGTTDTGMDALVPNAYFTYQFNSNLWLGLAVNSPFGLSADFPEFWAGRNYGANSSKLKTYNAAPSLAYRFNDWISVGIGAQIQFARVTLNQGLLAIIPQPPLPPAIFSPM